MYREATCLEENYGQIVEGRDRVLGLHNSINIFKDQNATRNRLIFKQTKLLH